MKIILKIIAWVINKLAEGNVTAIQETKLYKINGIIYEIIEDRGGMM